MWYGYHKRNVMQIIFCTKLTYAVRYKRLKQNKTFEDYLCYISQVNKYFRYRKHYTVAIMYASHATLFPLLTLAEKLILQ